MPSDDKPGWRQITFISWQARAAPAWAAEHCNILGQVCDLRSRFEPDCRPLRGREKARRDARHAAAGAKLGPGRPLRWHMLSHSRCGIRGGGACPAHGCHCGPVMLAPGRTAASRLAPSRSVLLRRARGAQWRGQWRAGRAPKPKRLPPRPNRGRACRQQAGCARARRAGGRLGRKGPGRRRQGA